MKDNFNLMIYRSKFSQYKNIRNKTRRNRKLSRNEMKFVFLLARTTAMALLDGVPTEVVAGIGAVSTMLATAASFLKSADRRQLHEKTSRRFRSLMVKMITCEAETDYEKYWADFNREIMDEPIMPVVFCTAND